MGIGCRLQGVETANRARGDAQRALAEGVSAAAVELVGRLDGGRELCVADSKHRGARAGLEAVEARNRFGRQGGMLLRKSQRLRTESLSWGWATQQRSNVQRHAECRICTEGMTG